jgi:hypothetical protein
MSIEKLKVFDIEGSMVEANKTLQPDQQITFESLSLGNTSTQASLILAIARLNLDICVYKSCRHSSSQTNKPVVAEEIPAAIPNVDASEMIERLTKNKDALQKIIDAVYAEYEKEFLKYSKTAGDYLPKKKNPADAGVAVQADGNIQEHPPQISQSFLIGASFSLDAIQMRLTELKKVATKLDYSLRKRAREKKIAVELLAYIQSQISIVENERSVLIKEMIARLSDVANGTLSLVLPEPSTTGTSPTSAKPVLAPKQKNEIDESEFLGYQDRLIKYWDYLDSDQKSTLANLPWNFVDSKTTKAEDLRDTKKYLAARFDVKDLVPTKVRRVEFFNKGHNFRARWFAEKSYLHANIDVGLTKASKSKGSFDENVDFVLGHIDSLYALKKSLSVMEGEIKKGRDLFKGRVKNFLYKKTVKFIDKLDASLDSQREDAIRQQVRLAMKIVKAFNDGNGTFRNKFGFDEKVSEFLVDTISAIDGLGARKAKLILKGEGISDTFHKAKIEAVLSKMRENPQPLVQTSSVVDVGAQEVSDVTDQRRSEAAELVKPILLNETKSIPTKQQLLALIEHFEKHSAYYLGTQEGERSNFMQDLAKIFTTFFKGALFQKLLLSSSNLPDRNDVLTLKESRNGAARFIDWFSNKILSKTTSEDGNPIRGLLSKYIKTYCDICLKFNEEKIQDIEGLSNADSLERERLFKENLNTFSGHGLKVRLQEMAEKFEEVLLGLSEGVDDPLFNDLKEMIERRKSNNQEELSVLAKKYVNYESKFTGQTQKLAASPPQTPPASPVKRGGLTQEEELAREKQNVQRMKSELLRQSEQRGILERKLETTERRAEDAEKKVDKMLLALDEEVVAEMEEEAGQKRTGHQQSF